MVIQYKCPNCGANMHYDSSNDKLHCDSCGTNKDIQDMPLPDIPEGTSDDTPDIKAFNPDEIEEEEISFDYVAEAQVQRNFNREQVKQYHCKNCGADIITDQDTAATTCSFCGAAVVLSDRLSGELTPAKVIPFRISKTQAQDAFRKWCKKGLLTPKDFMNADRIKSITGIYVPFWLYDIGVNGDVDAVCTKTRHYTRGDYIYTETSYYHVYRKVKLNYLKVPADASEKMNDTMMDKLEPYNYSDLKDFNMPYLAGYIAEKYNYTDKQIYSRIKQRVGQYANQYIRGTIQGYSSIRYNREDVQLQPLATFYTLLPVWMVCYDYKDSEHIFAMNGQTGKVVGKPPIAKSKLLLWFTGISAASFGIMQLITNLFLWT